MKIDNGLIDFALDVVIQHPGSWAFSELQDSLKDKVVLALTPKEVEYLRNLINDDMNWAETPEEFELIDNLLEDLK